MQFILLVLQARRDWQKTSFKNGFFCYSWRLCSMQNFPFYMRNPTNTDKNKDMVSMSILNNFLLLLAFTKVLSWGAYIHSCSLQNKHRTIFVILNQDANSCYLYLKTTPHQKEEKETFLNEESSSNMRLDSSFSINFVLKVHEIPCVKVQRKNKQTNKTKQEKITCFEPGFSSILCLKVSDHFTELSHLTHV